MVTPLMNDTVSSYCDAFNESQRDILSGTRGGTGAVCLVTTVGALILFIYMQTWKNFRHRILLFLTGSTVIYLFFFVLQVTAIWKETIGEVIHARLCKAIGFFIQYFGWQQLLLVSSITLYLYFYHVRDNDIFGPRRQGEGALKAKLGEALLYATLLLVPLIPAGLVIINDGYGETRGWCWIRSRDSDCKPFVEGILRQIFLWYMWCFICGVVTLAFLIKIICAMRSNAIQHSGKADRIAEEYNRRKAELVLLLVYLGMFHVVNFIELVACIISYAVPDNPLSHCGKSMQYCHQSVPLQYRLVSQWLYAAVIVMRFARQRVHGAVACVVRKTLMQTL